LRTTIHSLTLTLSIFLSVALLPDLNGQSSKQKGDTAWDQGKIKTAVNHYSKVDNILEDKSLLTKRGLGYFKLNKLKRAINDFTQSKKLGNDDPELFFLMAQSKQHLKDYEEAAYFYKEYIKAADTKSYQGQLALREIKNCAYSAFHQKDASTAFVESFGETVNTYYDEVYALQSPQFGNTFYFSSNRNLKHNDVYAYSINEKGEWVEDKEWDREINTNLNEYVMDVSTDGLAMLFTRTQGNELTTKIFVSSFDENDDQHIIELPEYLLDGAVDLQIVDYNTIAFASKDLGGFGGYDIFTLNYKNGVWSDPINEGEIINSEYDDRSPYFASNGKFLYFSSNRPYCFGGYDVYYYNKLGIAKHPTNMGAPLNSPGNDLHFRLHVDGQMAVMSSDRKSGAGAYDIYQVYLQDFKPMPPKDDRQLEYLKDYYNYTTPQEEIVEEPKTHLDILKERMEKEETDSAEETNSEPEEEIETVADTKRTTEPEKTDPISQTDDMVEAMTEIAETKEVKTVEETIDEAKDAIEQKTTDLTSEMDNKADKIVQVGRPAASESAKKDIEELSKTNMEENNSTMSTTNKTTTKTTTTKTDVAQSSDNSSETQSTTKPTQTSEKSYTTIYKPEQPENTKPAIPRESSGESPLNSLKKERRTTKPSNVKFISGEKLANTVLYQDRHDLMNDINKAKLDKLVSYLKQNLDHSVHFVAHTDHLELGLPEYMQYNTLKRANLLARYLMDNGVGQDRISIESVCANYPLIKPENAGKLNEEYLAYNKRIDWELRDRDKQVLMSQQLPLGSIPGYAIDRKHELYSLLREELYYSVEIAESPRIYKNAVLRLFTDIYIRKETQSSNNKYYIGIYNKYEDAVALKEKLDTSSAKYAKIVPFYNGMPISKSDLKIVAKDYPDLTSYISGER